MTLIEECEAIYSGKPWPKSALVPVEIDWDDELVEERPLLTPREIEVLQSITDGRSTVETARYLIMSPKTAKNFLAQIYKKLDVCDRTQAVVEGLRTGIEKL